MSEWLQAAQSGSGTLINSKPFVFVPIAAFVRRAAPSIQPLGHLKNSFCYQLVEPEIRQLRQKSAEPVNLEIHYAEFQEG
jgi:hypothetical protein